mmetsp:Transcript_31866/g.5759  ORF Transcript_31866/g.5759 Transcript_31866/m.5759 type:complete len:166 (+) Transcript_31866:206-703(+)
MVFFCAGLMYYSLKSISIACFKAESNHYGTVVEKILNKELAVLLEIGIISNAVGLIIGYNIIIGELFVSVLNSIDIKYDDEIKRLIVILVLNAFIILPLGLLRKLGALRYKAFFNVTSLTFVLLLVVIEFGFYVPQNNYDDIKYFDLDLRFFGSLQLPMLGYLCH